MELYQEIAQAVYRGKYNEVRQLVEKGLAEKKPVADILNQGLVAGMEQVGKDFKANKIFIPEVLISAKAMHAGMALLRPVLAETGVKPLAKAVIGTVQGDLHDIGKNLVAMMWEGAGIDVVDLGVDCSPEKFLNAVKQNDAQLVGLSALLTTTMTSMPKIIQGLKDAGLRDQVKILVGGAPLDSNYAKEIGADAYAPDAASAVEIARNLLKAA